MKLFARLFSAIAVAAVLAPQGALADSIDPITFGAELEAGESVTIRKTVVVDEGTTSAVLDVMFLIDTSGSMGPHIANAKLAAGDILSGLAGFGNVATGTGYYSEPGSLGVYRDLTTDPTAGQQNINDIVLGLGGGGGDFPEEGINGTYEAATGASWRPGSNRFIIALGDATFKESDGVTTAMALAALADNNITFIGLDFGNLTYPFQGIDPTILADATGGAIYTASTDPATIVTAILDSITASFLTYSTVGVSDLGGGLPGVAVSSVCVSADTGACSGATATGSYDRSVARTFEFDVTFTGLEEGTHVFDTHGLVDGGIVASERDTIIVGPGGPVVVAEPGTLLLLGAGLLGAGLIRRRRGQV